MIMNNAVFAGATSAPEVAIPHSSHIHQISTNILKSINISSIAEYNITTDNLDDFLQILWQQKVPHNVSATDNCDAFCNGLLRELLLDYRSVHGYISFLICLFGTIANILNIIVLTRREMSKTPINKILQWLAVADMFVMIEYIPFTTYMYIISPEEKDFRYWWAVYLLFHMHFSQILHTISIGLTVTLAVWRYVAIRHPQGTFAGFLLSHCNEAIVLAFMLSPILCFPTYFVFKVKEKHLADMDKTLYHVGAEENTALYRFNFWVHSVLIKLLPCCVLTVISCILINVLCDATKRRIKLKEYSNPNKGSFCNSNQRSSKSMARPDRTTMLLVAVLLLFLITEFPQGILGLMSGILENCFFVRCYHLFGEVMDLLALTNAAIGFVLYGLMSKQFRTSFKLLFFKPRLSRLELTGVTGVTTTCV